MHTSKLSTRITGSKRDATHSPPLGSPVSKLKKSTVTKNVKSETELYKNIFEKCKIAINSKDESVKEDLVLEFIDPYSPNFLNNLQTISKLVAEIKVYSSEAKDLTKEKEIKQKIVKNINYILSSISFRVEKLKQEKIYQISIKSENTTNMNYYQTYLDKIGIVNNTSNRNKFMEQYSLSKLKLDDLNSKKSTKRLTTSENMDLTKFSDYINTNEKLFIICQDIEYGTPLDTLEISKQIERSKRQLSKEIKNNKDIENFNEMEKELIKIIVENSKIEESDLPFYDFHGFRHTDTGRDLLTSILERILKLEKKNSYFQICPGTDTKTLYSKVQSRLQKMTEEDLREFEYHEGYSIEKMKNLPYRTSAEIKKSAKRYETSYFMTPNHGCITFTHRKARPLYMNGIEDRK